MVDLEQLSAGQVYRLYVECMRLRDMAIRHGEAGQHKQACVAGQALLRARERYQAALNALAAEGDITPQGA